MAKALPPLPPRGPPPRAARLRPLLSERRRQAALPRASSKGAWRVTTCRHHRVPALSIQRAPQRF
eukprot:9966905-Alexandrium_andersonii.AAC.1